jgi:predicted porin
MSNHAILSVAALVLFAGTAAAQSSVTMYGIADIDAGRFKGAVTGVNAHDGAAYRLDSGGMSTSRLGFRGNEDLGGGLSASFDLSTFIRMDTGQAGRSDAIGPPANVAADPLWSRAAWVGLASSQFGRLRLGNVSTLMWVGAITTNAFDDSTTFSPLDLVTFVGGPLTGGTAWTNSAVYDSPDIAGFSFAAARALAEGQGGANSALRVAYAKQAASVSLSWQSVKKNPLTFADGTSPNNTRSWLLAGSYDFSLAKVYAHLGQIQNHGTEAAPLGIRYRLWELSTSVPVGSGFILAGYASRTTGDAVGPVPAAAPTGNKERAVLSVGYDYYLSKRTDLYAMAMHDRTTTNTLPAPPSAVDASANNIAFGMRHRF